MCRITTFNRVSADGYFSALDADLNWAGPDDEIDAAAAGETLRATCHRRSPGAEGDASPRIQTQRRLPCR
jgi:hypothetical protein